MYAVELTVDEEIADTVPAELLTAAAQATLSHQKAPAGELTILITTDDRLAELNRAYLGIDAATDVLAFPAGRSGPTLPDQPLYFGDIAISLPRARAQAAAAGHLSEAELQLLVVHGTLHLLGYDHAEEQEKAVMWAAQEHTLKHLGVSVNTNW